MNQEIMLLNFAEVGVEKKTVLYHLGGNMGANNEKQLQTMLSFLHGILLKRTTGQDNIFLEYIRHNPWQFPLLLSPYDELLIRYAFYSDIFNPVKEEKSDTEVREFLGFYRNTVKLIDQSYLHSFYFTLYPQARTNYASPFITYYYEQLFLFRPKSVILNNGNLFFFNIKI